MRNLLALAVLFLVSICCSGQETFPLNGTKEKDVVYHAFTNATIFLDYQSKVENATLLIFNNRVVASGAEVSIPDNAVIHDMKGKFIYPSFVDLNSDYGMPKVTERKWSSKPQYETSKEGAFGWNESIKPEIRTAELFSVNKESAKKLRSMGFGAVLTHAKDGIARGTSSLVALGNDANESMLVSEAGAHYSFRKGSSGQNYPSSLMGGIALLRQTYYDGLWYNSGEAQDKNLSLEAWNDIQELPQFFETSDKLDIFRADKIGDEFDIQYTFIGSGNEYQRLEEVKNTGGGVVVPLNFPAAFDVSDPYVSRLVSLNEMKHWELAPSNPARLAQAGIDFTLSSIGLKDGAGFFKSLRKANNAGLSEQEALKALTITPALILGQEHQLGHLHTGALGNFIICSGSLFSDGVVIYENWVTGDQHVIQQMDITDLRGEYNLNLEKDIYPLKVKGKPGKYKGQIELISAGDSPDTTHVSVKISQQGDQVTLLMNLNNEDDPGVIRLAGNVNMDSRIWDGKGEMPNGRWIEWAAVRQSERKEKNKKNSTDSLISPEVGPVVYPFRAYGWEEQPEAETVWIKNATVWTCEDEGVIENGQVLIRNGKIAAVGRDLNLGDLFPKEEVNPAVIDAKGKHVTPGIIDEHSHIAISRGVNEGTQASSAEVSIATAVNSEDINIYRQLAGGVTASQLLHGSANPIGGQSAMIKLRWGDKPDDMLVEGAAPFIKFALGENVKQSNWGPEQKIRFPQTRMGVEQVYYDHFIMAREYGDKLKQYESNLARLSKKQKKKGQYPVSPRTDLEMETLLQILNHERFITCHSYRQDEINMLMHVADSMGFRLNTFTHILEGYKVADKLAQHGAGASSFSDWWAYKFEVKDAIPYNGALLWEQGIVTAFNSDDREMARRLNQEAAKAVKYGNVPEEEALKFVTLNPAKLLHLDDRMGSLKIGKDADLVLWSDHPLSIYAKAEKTFVDGICYFDIERDQEIRKEISKERARLIQKMLDADSSGEKTQKPRAKENKHYHCDTITNELAD